MVPVQAVASKRIRRKAQYVYTVSTVCCVSND